MNPPDAFPQEVDILGVPLELGADCPGIRQGADAIRAEGVAERCRQLGYRVHDLGNINTPDPSAKARSPRNCLHLPAVRQANEALSRTVSKSLSAGHFPLVLGGDHSLALGTLAGASCHYPKLGVIWIDAHGDMNTHRTTPSGHIHGMPLAASMGYGHPRLTWIGGRKPKINPLHTVIIGCRSLDPGEKRFIRRNGIRIIPVEELRRLGTDHVVDEALRIAGTDTDGVHLSFDLDVLDPGIAPGVSTPVPGGLSLSEAMALLERIRMGGCGRIASAEFVELNPALDVQRATAALAVELIVKLLERDGS